jgi:hypothetical protein
MEKENINTLIEKESILWDTLQSSIKELGYNHSVTNAIRVKWYKISVQLD